MNKILSKEELNKFLGEESFWSPLRLVNYSAYMTGVDSFEIDSKNVFDIDIPNLVNFMKRPLGLQIEMAKNFKWMSIGVLNDQISSIFLEDKEQLTEKKEKSVIGRALLGGLLLGPVGAIVGGMSGLGDKEVKVKMPELILSISLTDDSILLFSCKYKDRVKVSEFFKKAYPQKFQLI